MDLSDEGADGGTAPRIFGLEPILDQSPSLTQWLSDIFRENSRKVITRLAICSENFH